MAEPVVPAEPGGDTEWVYPAGEGRGGTPRRVDAPPVLSVEGFEGPLDFLIEMVRRHRIDLGRLSILALVEQCVAVLEAKAGQVAIERRGDWLVMASTLVLLRAQLLAPASPEAAARAEAEAGRRIGQLEEMVCMRGAAAWLAARPQLGVDVFGRGRVDREVGAQAEQYVAFLEATLTMLEGPGARGGEPLPAYRPVVPELWRVVDALAWLGKIFAVEQGSRPLEQCLPPIAEDACDRPLRFRVAIASTLVAGLELAREGKLTMEQDQMFGLVRLSPSG